MKIIHLTTILIITMIGITPPATGQKCHDFHKSNICALQGKDGFKLSTLSRSHYLGVGKTITYEVVLYGQKDIIIQCCTEEKYYPVRFKLKSALNGDVIYDNIYDNYINSIQLALDRTELILIEITIDPKDTALQGTKACLGMAIYMEKTELRQ